MHSSCSHLAALRPIEALETRRLFAAGLSGQYFDNKDFTNLKTTRVDSTVDYYWDSAAPVSGVGADTFSVRWTGQVKPQFSESYTFITRSDDGIRLWVNNVLLIDKLTNQNGMTEFSGSIALTAGQNYDIRIDYFDNTGKAGARLFWQSSSVARQIIPSSRLFSVPTTTTPDPKQTPYLGVPFSIGQMIEAENFDNGGEGVSYHDTTNGNQGTQYRAQCVDINFAFDVDGGYTLAFTKAGEWLEYTVNIPATGNYLLESRVASQGTGGKFHVEFDGTNATGSIQIPDTVTWANFQTLSNAVQLTSGIHVMRVALDANNSGGGIGNLNWFRLVSTPANVATLGVKATTVSTTEGSATPLVFNVTRTGDISANLTVEYSLHGSALNGADYQAMTGSLIIPAGSKSFALPVKTINDAIVEGDETVWLTLSQPAGFALTPAFASAIIRDNDKFVWTSIAPSPLPRAEANGAAVGGKLYVFGGFRDGGTNGRIPATTLSDAYDVASNTWTHITDMPLPLTHCAPVVVGTDIWLIAGYLGDHPGPGVTTVLIYDTLTDTWRDGPSLPEKRGAGAAAIIDRVIHFTGGMDETRTIEEPTHWAFDLDDQAAGWVRLADLPNPRNHTTAKSVDGKLYVVGGQYLQEANSVPQDEVDAYDPVTDKWTKVASLPRPKTHIISSTLVMDGRIIVVGGDSVTSKWTTDLLAYDPVTDAWDTLTPLPAARGSVVAGLIDGAIVLSTGNGPEVTTAGWIGRVVSA